MHPEPNLVDKLDGHERKIIAVACPGDRRDEDIAESATILAGHYDHYVLKADDNRRGRGDDEVPQLMKKNLLEQGVSEDTITIIPDEQTAIQHTLELGQEKDLLVIIGDNVARSWKQIVHFGDGMEKDQTAAKDEPAISMNCEDLVDEDQSLISDDRGVRVAKEIDEDAD